MYLRGRSGPADGHDVWFHGQTEIAYAARLIIELHGFRRTDKYGRRYNRQRDKYAAVYALTFGRPLTETRRRRHLKATVFRAPTTAVSRVNFVSVPFAAPS